jgi:hypothetical protein
MEGEWLGKEMFELKGDMDLISKLVDPETLNLKFVSPLLSSPLKGFDMNKLKVQPWVLPYPLWPLIFSWNILRT